MRWRAPSTSVWDAPAGVITEPGTMPLVSYALDRFNGGRLRLVALAVVVGPRRVRQWSRVGTSSGVTIRLDLTHAGQRPTVTSGRFSE